MQEIRDMLTVEHHGALCVKDTQKRVLMVVVIRVDLIR
jgi:hypothetical protein